MDARFADDILIHEYLVTFLYILQTNKTSLIFKLNNDYDIFKI